MCLRYSFILFLLAFFVQNSHAQQYFLRYIKKIQSEKEVEQITDSLPLFIFENKVYQIQSECIKRREGFDYNSRLDGAATNQRLNDGGGNARLNDDGNIGRNMGGGANDRLNGGGMNERNNSGGIDFFGCSTDEWGRLIIYTNDPKKTKSAKIFYENKLYSYNDNFFKIKKL